MRYGVILNVEDVLAAPATGMLLQRYGYKIVSTQIAPPSCPIQPEATDGEGCPAIDNPSAPNVDDAKIW